MSNFTPQPEDQYYLEVRLAVPFYGHRENGRSVAKQVAAAVYHSVSTQAAVMYHNIDHLGRDEYVDVTYIPPKHDGVYAMKKKPPPDDTPDGGVMAPVPANPKSPSGVMFADMHYPVDPDFDYTPVKVVPI